MTFDDFFDQVYRADEYAKVTIKSSHYHSTIMTIIMSFSSELGARDYEIEVTTCDFEDLQKYLSRIWEYIVFPIDDFAQPDLQIHIREK